MQAKEIRSLRINSASRGGDISVCRSVSTAVAPEHRVKNMSLTETSKLSDANCSTRSLGPIFQ